MTLIVFRSMIFIIKLVGKNMFIATTYQNKPAVLDTKTNVYYFGFKTMNKAKEKALQLNKENT